MNDITLPQPRFFRLEEFYFSQTAIANRLLNFPASRDQRCINFLARLVLDPVRTRFGKPIRISSGFRCPALNTLVNGSANSDHLTGCAADIVPVDNTREERIRLWIICETLTRKKAIPVKQLINEHDFSWVHISIDLDPNSMVVSANPRRQIFDM